MPLPTLQQWRPVSLELQQRFPSHRDRLQAIERDLGLFNLWGIQPMSRRNLALAILRRIGDMGQSLRPQRLPLALADLLADAEAVLQERLNAHAYDEAICIGYRVQTGHFDRNAFMESNGYGLIPRARVAYGGAISDRADAIARCDRMKTAITHASGLYRQAFPTSYATLKIFMAPEFYFRGANGAYDVSLVSEIFENLRRFTSHDNFRNWLFIFGTVIAASYEHRSRCRHCGSEQFAQNFVPYGSKRRRTAERTVCARCRCDQIDEVLVGARIDNCALVQKGGERSDRNAYVVQKEYISHIDFRRAVQHVAHFDLALPWSVDRRIELSRRTVQALPPPGSHDLGGSFSRFQDERMGGAIFTIDGISFGLEICLDHLNRRLTGATGVQIQLVPSAGASLVYLACVPGGIAFNVDGGGNGSCDARVNDGGSSRIPLIRSMGLASGGSIDIYAPTLIPY